MGHIRLGNLPRTRAWQEVIGLLDTPEASTADVAAATLKASKSGLAQAGRDPALVYSFWLLTQLPLCARSQNFESRLRSLGLEVPNQPGLFDLVGSLSEAVDRRIQKVGGRTDLGEMAQMGAIESLSSILSERSPSLFGTTPIDVRLELGRLATVANFSYLARDFFARLSERYLTYFISKQASNRFSTIHESRAFREGLRLHCRQAAKIVERFAGEWFSKHNFQGGISEKKAGNFVAYAMKKLRDEFQKGAEGAQQ
jgi:hypothetical protein